MKIHNVRLGFATNSSSSHSVVVLPRSGFLSDDMLSDGAYGWEHFTAASAEAKCAYAAQQVAGFLRQTHNLDDITDAIASRTQRLCGAAPDPQGYVDHQSTWALPHEWDGTDLDESFVAALMAHLMRDDVAVLGGNDNGDDHADKAHAKHDLGLPEESRGYVCRDDEPFWTLFHREDGRKIRISFDENAGAYAKARYPELVDVKVTDHCPYGCDYCYQGSTPQGEHAALADIEHLAEALADVRCFEVALGGGEPTLHPDWHAIIDTFHRRHVIPNFTTRNLAWVFNPANAETLAKVGGFAFSVDKASEIAALADWHRSRPQPYRHFAGRPEVTIQYVLGTSSDEEFRAIARATAEAGFRLTILGFKRVGRGELFRLTSTKDPARWIGLIEELRAEERAHNDKKAAAEPYMRACPSVSIDTALALESREALDRKGVPKWGYHVTEGAFSMYVDAVNKVVAPSSYCPPADYEPLSYGHLWDTFAQFPSEPTT